MRTLLDDIAEKQKRDRFLFDQRIRYVLNNPVSSLITNMALGLVLCFLLVPVFDQGRLCTWVLCLLAVCLGRVFIAWMYDRHNDVCSPKTWFRLYCTGTEVSALVWASTALFLFPADSPGVQLYLVAVLAGLVHGAGHNQAPFRRVHYLYAVTVMGPIILRFVSMGTIYHWTLALALIFLIAAVLVSTRTMRRILGDSLELRYEMSQMALIDSLTSVANRRHFDMFIYQEWRKAQREGVPIAMLMVDVDHFKLYNDVYGHQKGDQCLVDVARAIEGVIHRPSDLVARYGGEEFGVILANTPLAGARSVAEQMRQAVEALGIEHHKSQVAPFVTVSIGVAVMCPGRDGHLNALVSAADEALYRAKEYGRNRVCVYRDDAGSQYDAPQGRFSRSSP